ncbi:hypothetical protein GCM10027570_48350 [Streptomonospora sediminis]
MAGADAPRGSDAGSDGAPLDPPSMVQMAQERIRRLILSGEVGPDERLAEERLSERLGVSRPPLREAMRLLQQEGLVVAKPRRGSFVAALTDTDVHEILTLRTALERLAVDLGVPVREPERLRPCWAALERMQEAAKHADRGALVESGYAFHAAIVALAGHRRVNEMYHSLQQQLLLCMARNLHVRENYFEDLDSHVDRHRHLLRLIEAGDPAAVHAEMAVHGERSFLAVDAAAGPGAGGGADTAQGAAEPPAAGASGGGSGGELP